MPIRQETDLLSNVPLFRGLTAKELNAIRKQGREIPFRAGNVIVRAGDKGGRFYLILDGTAQVDMPGRRKAVLGPGEFFGEISLLDGGPRTATVTAEKDMRTFSIAEFNFRPLLKVYPSMCLKLTVELCARLRRVEQSITM